MQNPKEADVHLSSAVYTPVRAPRGTAISCKGWQQEAVLRMLMNSVDPDVAEHAETLLASSELGSVAVDWAAFHAIANSLRDLANDATLLVRQGKMSGITQTSKDSPRALVLDSGAAASWTYIGPQCFLPDVFGALAAAKQQYSWGDMGGKFVASSSMAGSRVALPLAATMHGAVFLGIDANSERIKRCVKTGYCDVMVNSLDEALRILKNAVRKHEAASVGLLGNPADVIPEMASRGVVPDLLSAAENQENATPNVLQDGIRALGALGSILLTSLSSSEASGSIHCVALSGEPTDIQRIDRLLVELFPGDEQLSRWIRTLQRRLRHQGLPARAYRLSADQRVRFGSAVNRLAANGEVKAPIVIVHHAPTHMERQSELAKARERDSPSNEKLSALIELSRGATWASMDHDEHGNIYVTAQAIAADGSSETNARIERVLSA